VKPFPELWTVGLHTYSSGSSDGYGGTADTYTPPPDQPGTPYPVIAIAPASSEEPRLAGHDRVLVEVEVLAYKDTLPATAHDLIDLPDGTQYEVIGDPEDFTQGLIEGFGGIRVNLKKSTG
jgi:hypothetical protein